VLEAADARDLDFLEAAAEDGFLEAATGCC
jgi:hypothetical protein